MRFESVSRKALALAAAVVLAGGCSDDDGPTGPGGLDFPALSNTVRNLYCVRGNTTAGETVSGSITAGDCNDDGSYFESYLVKVKTTGSVTFTLTHQFDGVLGLVDITQIRDDDVVFTEVDYVDDEFAGSPEVLTYTLQAGRNYAIFVAGFDQSDVGSYSLRIQ